ncbi:MAG: hypothetical protein GY744_20640, partial [Gammaproteobacteria bacterium]|nr:hypothetical protein [Gammaproteobacteria bacterium]
VYLAIVFTPFVVKAEIINNSPYILWVKPETGDDIIHIEPNNFFSNKHDGFTFECNNQWFVYKTIDNIDAYVEKNCDVKFSTRKNWLYFILQKIFGGLIIVPPDASWQPLFDKRIDFTTLKNLPIYKKEADG